MIREAVAEYDYPVLFGVPVGHEGYNCPILEGAEYKLSVTKEGGSWSLYLPAKDNKRK